MPSDECTLITCIHAPWLESKRTFRTSTGRREPGCQGLAKTLRVRTLWYTIHVCLSVCLLGAAVPLMWHARFATPRAGELHLRPFLLGSAVCDCDHPAVIALSRELVGRCSSVTEAAASVRLWVRAHIVYTLQDKSDRASETLAKREGMCTNKANLQVALLHCAACSRTCRVHPCIAERPASDKLHPSCNRT